MSGSEAEQLGAEYIISEYEEAGLENCRIETYSVNMFEINRAEVSLVSYGPLMNLPNPVIDVQKFEHIEDYVLQGYSGSYAWGDFRDDLEIVVVGNGTDTAAFSAANGKAALVEAIEKSPGNPAMYTAAYEAGAKALILQNLWRGDKIGFPPQFKSNQAYEDWGGTYPEIPFFMVSKAVGDVFKERMVDSKLRLDFDVYKGPMDICVTVGEIPGTSGSDDFILLGGHHDTCYNTLGVIDNTVGPSIICEMAHQLAKYEQKYTIRFCTFGGEEEGLYGSTAYFDAHQAEFENNLLWMHNFDMSHTNLQRTNRFVVTTSQNSTIDLYRQIRDEMVEKTPELEKYDIDAVYDSGIWAGSDHWPWASHGYKVTNAWGGGCWEYHTYQDDIDQLNPESLQIGGRLVGSFILTKYGY
jgi:Zn-dependent M28 family amino/carboxypeptidase